MYVSLLVHLGIELYLFVSHGGMNYRGSTCKFCNARSAFRNLQVDPCLSYLHEKQTGRIQSLYLYFIKIVPFWLRNIRFLIQNTQSLFYGVHYSALHRLMSLHGKLDVKIFLMFIIAENTGSVNINVYLTPNYSLEMVPLQLNFRRYLGIWRISAWKKCGSLSRVYCRWWTLTFFWSWFYNTCEIPRWRNG